MKVLLINGSPHKTGCTNRALEEVASALEARGIGTEIVWLGNGPIGGCQGCGYCSSNDTCTIDDIVNDIRPKVAAADGYVFGCAVHYAGMTGNLLGFMDRLFYTASSDLAFKPAAGICSARRGGTTATFDQINKYFTINQMPVVSSCYWNMVHGGNAADVEQDKEGLRTMRTLGNNMAWLLKCIEAGRAAGLDVPEPEPPARTNFIR